MSTAFSQRGTAYPRSPPADRTWKCAEPIVHEAHVREEAGHRHSGAIVADLRLGALPFGQGDCELRVAAAGRERQREGTAEAGVHVGDRQRAVGLPEALDAGRADDSDRLGDPGSRAGSARCRGSRFP